MYNYGYIVFMLPALVISLICQIAVKTTFSKYSNKRSNRGLTGADAARKVLSYGADGVTAYGVNVTAIKGALTDHYDPRTNEIRLSEPVYGNSSIASVGVAAHEAGHALQYASSYPFIKIRASLIPVCNLGASFAPILIVIGLVFAFEALYLAGIIAYSTVALFQLVTLPVEFNASRRAISAIKDSGMLDEEEIKGAKKVLTAAALTYVAALFTSLMQIFYYIQIGNRRRR